MMKEKMEDVKNSNINVDENVDKAKFISSDEDEQEGNFEFLCCRGGGVSMGGGGLGGRW
ncbi:hypothetical protein [Serratia quinivorans]|uniref:hypothetical protein n=1 Tax=Serratia quinivorans TaxID=137545 RepID=UPI00217C786B|nr:hypothetical protein [Serratia quinivorans]CAI0845646.1 Uncharacterised protein [Serratia quinivorans]CAI1602077.1 Uncharacterised protein [Serratia quinivorans]